MIADVHYFRLAYYNSHPSVAFWFVFWHDFWCLNRDLKVVEDAKDFLDPFNAAAICYHPVTHGCGLMVIIMIFSYLYCNCARVAVGGR